jgi:hypothetical protein
MALTHQGTPRRETAFSRARCDMDGESASQCCVLKRRFPL